MFTKGPWTFHPEDASDTFLYSEATDEQIVDMKNVRTGNAVLMQHSPAMLEALESVIDTLELDALNDPGLVSRVENIKSVISKARGES